MIASGSLAAIKITVGIMAGSAAVVSDGVESGADVLASGIVLLGLLIASKPADAEHPYGYGRVEALAGLAVGLMLAITGAGICFGAAQKLSLPRTPPLYATWPLVLSMATKGVLSYAKFRFARRINSEALGADAWNDAVDILSAFTALVAVSLSVWRPDRFGRADAYGAFVVGVIVVFLGARVIYETTQQLMDRMPEPGVLEEIRRVALGVPGACGVEKCYARKTGLRYHVDLHLEVDPNLTVRESHFIAHEVRDRIVAELNWVADVLVHVEPHAADTIESRPRWRTGR
jgi:cation diffusion facilitator family transporter